MDTPDISRIERIKKGTESLSLLAGTIGTVPRACDTFTLDKAIITEVLHEVIRAVVGVHGITVIPFGTVDPDYVRAILVIETIPINPHESFDGTVMGRIHPIVGLRAIIPVDNLAGRSTGAYIIAAAFLIALAITVECIGGLEAVTIIPGRATAQD